MKFTNRTYDFLKDLALLYLPGLGTLYFALAGYWDFPNPDAVVGSIMALDTFLGGILKLKTNQYNKTDKYDGTIDVETTSEGKKIFSLNVAGDLDELDQKEEITFKVNPVTK